MAAFLDQYEPLDVIGNGSFGIIRKVRRKADSIVFARKELNFERMSEHDRKQIVAEVNILKDLHHDNIVRYHDRFVDRDAGILYILMEYCGGGDLSCIIKQAQKQNRLIPEDAIWNYFMQILLALHHCHHPNGHGRSSSTGGLGSDGKERRAQILHRDLKPDNVFLDEANRVKLGDFGLSKALAQASFANTYVGTPYYMSPELMQEKAYDSKSDIWSLGCLIYELCALKPPFHEAKTHAELSIFIRNGRIPPLSRVYSQSLYAVIKSMLNLNPAMRPSAAQLLQHERLELVFKISETEKMISTVKTHKTTVAAKERDVLAREASLVEKESQLSAILAQKESEILSLQSTISQLREQLQSQAAVTTVEHRIRDAISRREEELRAAVMKREEEVAIAMARREQEIMHAIRLREEEIAEAWRAREEQIRDEISKAMQEREAWLDKRADELRLKEESLESIKRELESEIKQMEPSAGKKERKEKIPLEEVHNILAHIPVPSHDKQMPSTPAPTPFPAVLATPIGRTAYPQSAMKGIILTSTGETLATPTPGELAKLFVESPKVGLNFGKIFDFDDETENENTAPTSPTVRDRPRLANSDDASQQENSGPAVHPTRLRKPSIVRLRPPTARASTTTSDPGPAGSSNTVCVTRPAAQSQPSSSSKVNSVPISSSKPSVEYDFNNDENLPSPFLKRVDRGEVSLPASSGGAQANKPVKRVSNGNLLRAVAAANAANAGGTGRKTGADSTPSNQTTSATGTRPLLLSARKATEEARKVLLRS